MSVLNSPEFTFGICVAYYQQPIALRNHKKNLKNKNVEKLEQNLLEAPRKGCIATKNQGIQSKFINKPYDWYFPSVKTGQ